MFITLNDIAEFQLKHGRDVQVSYSWKESTKTPVPQLVAVYVFFMKPNVDAWKYLMTSQTDGFSITVSGTRNKPHDGLDDCYRESLKEVNAIRESMNQKPITI